MIGQLMSLGPDARAVVKGGTELNRTSERLMLLQGRIGVRTPLRTNLRPRGHLFPDFGVFVGGGLVDG